MDRVLFPSKEELKEGVLLALKELGGGGTTQEINKKVAEVMVLPEEVINKYYDDGLCTLLEYRLRWVRTEMKGLISNTRRGYWELNDKISKS